MRLKTLFIALIIAVSLHNVYVHAEEYAKEKYPEDTVEEDGKLVKIRIDTDSGAVACYWDDETHAWMDASLCQFDLDKAYKDKIEFKEMQAELDEMKDETWDDRYR